MAYFQQQHTQMYSMIHAKKKVILSQKEIHLKFQSQIVKLMIHHLKCIDLMQKQQIIHGNLRDQMNSTKSYPIL
jgi:hypothetical protein